LELSRTSAGKSALLLTLLAVVSQTLGFGYRVVLSRLVGAEVMGLYQLVMPVYSVLLSLSAVGLASAVSNLTPQHLALGNSRGAAQTLSLCLRLFFLLLLPMGLVVIPASDAISVHLLGDARTQLGLILLIPCVALTGVENIHKHYFYGSSQVVQPALVELLEQFIRTAAVLGLLILFLPQYPERVVGLIVAGMVICEVFSALTLATLYRRRQSRTALSGPGETPRIRLGRVASIALPVGANALLGNLMGAVNAALIPQKLMAAGLERTDAISQLGVVCGMTMPMLALPTVFLGPMNLILIPRLARAVALGRPGEIRRLADRAITAVALLILPSMSLLVVLGPDLGSLLYGRTDVGRYLVPLASTMTLSCLCSVLGAVLNGVGGQRAVAAVSLLGGAVQLFLSVTLIPLPGVGMAGYVAGVLLSTVLEAFLYLILALRRTGLRLCLFRWMIAPGLASLLAGLTAQPLLRCVKDAGLTALPAGAVSLVFGLILYLSALSAQGIDWRGSLRIRW